MSTQNVKQCLNYIVHLQAIEEMLQKINVQVFNYMPFQFQSTEELTGPLLKIETDPESEGAELIIESLNQEVYV